MTKDRKLKEKAKKNKNKQSTYEFNHLNGSDISGTG